MDQTGEEVHEMFCVDQRRPDDSESCNSHVCEFIWITGDWTEVRVNEWACFTLIMLSNITVLTDRA